jgi:hypothetical protein
MIPVSRLCKQRQVNAIDVRTPILIPSFSSKAFLKEADKNLPEIRWIWTNVKDYLTDTALISSYDIYYDYLPVELDGPNILFVDSGGYEKQKDDELSRVLHGVFKPPKWSPEEHTQAISKIKTFSSLALVSLDTRGDIATQIRAAKDFFASHQEVATDFLIKPSPTASVITTQEVEASAHLFDSFDLIGVAEKELGDTLAERLRTIACLRTALSNTGLETPIHILGCLDPITIWLFFLCGADVFDGLLWLRLIFQEYFPVYLNSWAALYGHGGIGSDALLIMALVKNLKALSRQRMQMARYSFQHNTRDLPSEWAFNSKLEGILNRAGVTLVERSQ